MTGKRAENDAVTQPGAGVWDGECIGRREKHEHLAGGSDGVG